MYKLKRDKATGFDNIMNEYLITGKTLLLPILCKLFHNILDTGNFPEIWVKSVIVPVYKKGDVDEPSNYRGISLVSHVGKFFTSLLNTRLLEWSEKNSILTDAQYGFRPGFGTVDAVFALHSIINNSLSKNKRLYCCFIDYSRAFDSVSHYKLWKRLVRCGVTGKILNVIKSMYSKLKSCVKVNNVCSEFFEVSVGLMQGESLSPILYSLYVNDMEIELIKQNYKSYELRTLNLYLLMYADDMVLFSEDINDLQKLINTVNVYSNKYDLYINLTKTKIVVFRNRGKVKNEEKWYLNGNLIEICNEFTYLGLLLYYNGNFVNTQKKLSEQGRKAVFSLFNKIQDDYYNQETLLSLFDTYVASILNYCCEVWSVHKAPEIEKVHLYFLKRILKVKKSTVNNMLYCELGRLPLYIERE